VFERSPGVKQWAYRGHPLYTYVENGESDVGSLVGNDIPGWHSVYTQHVAAPPSDFMFQDTPAGQVVADRRGHTVYIYNCTEDTIDQFACNLPDSPQQYRLAVCGGGDPDTCNRLFPYVRVSSTAKNQSSLWQSLLIDPHTGHEAGAGDKDAVQVWAYRGSPVYTYADDPQPGAINGHGWGEGSGHRNGFTAFFVRNDFSRSGP
jgi:predicted lipoprotein with Yx(FWY)xxD motif